MEGMVILPACSDSAMLTFSSYLYLIMANRLGLQSTMQLFVRLCILTLPA